jgi:anti-sigma factor RsiW
VSSAAHEHEQTYEALGAYALGALDEPGIAAVESHLEQCTECQDSLAGMQAAVDHLPSTVPVAAPPPELKARLMAQVEAEAELMRAASGDRADRPVPSARRLLGRFSLGPVALAGACTVLLLAGFFIGVTRHDGETPIRTLAATVDRDRAPQAEASLVRRGSDVTLEVRRLPQAPRGRVYQLWLQRGDHRAPTPTNTFFSVSSQGSGHVAVPSADLSGVRRVLVTAEPPGGSSVPSQLVPLISAPVS